MSFRDALEAELDEFQRQAVTTDASRVLVVAGPGSGKTRVLVWRAAWLLESGVPPGKVMAITFTNRAAGEMKDRVQKLLSTRRVSWVGTFHSMCVRLIRRYGSCIGIVPSFGVIDADDSLVIVKRAITELTGDPDVALRRSAEVVAAISRAKVDLKSPVTHPDPLVAACARRYQEQLEGSAMLDFDDLISAGVRLVGHPESGPAIRARFTHVLVDEYQDTNAAQCALLGGLVGEEGSIFAVGDAQQSIYGFRGSTVDALERFSDDWPGTVRFELGRNWRSTGRIVAVAEAFGQRTGVSNRARLWTTSEPGPAVRVVGFDDDRAEADAVAGEIAATGPPWGRLAVLVRTHATTRLVEAALTRAGVPYTVVGGARFWDRAEIRDVLAWLRLAIAPSHRPAWYRAAQVPRRGLGNRTLERVMEGAAQEGVTPLEWVESQGVLLPRVGPELARFAAQIRTVAFEARSGPLAAVEAVLGIEGFVEAACGSGSRHEMFDERKENLEELRSAAASFTIDDPSLVDRVPTSDRGWVETVQFCTQTSLEQSSDRADGDAVWLSTVHGSKGREFDRVWVVGVEDGIFPHLRSSGDPREVEEELRLLFVAATRARRHLALTWAESRMVGGRVLDRRPSQFLDLILPLQSSGAVQVEHPENELRRFRTVRALDHHRARSSLAPSPPPDGYRLGDRVHHASFGEGVVVEVSGINVVRVRFGDRARSLDVSIAPLRRV